MLLGISVPTLGLQRIDANNNPTHLNFRLGIKLSLLKETSKLCGTCHWDIRIRYVWETQITERYLSGLFVYDPLPVKISFRYFRNEERDMIDREEQINEFEKQFEGRGMQIKNITMSADMCTNELAQCSIFQ